MSVQVKCQCTVKFDEDFFNRFKFFLSLRCHVQGEYFTVVSTVTCSWSDEWLYNFIGMALLESDAPVILYLSQ